VPAVSEKIAQKLCHIHFFIGKQGISPLGYADPDIHACGIPEHTTPQSLYFLAGITILVSE